MVFQTCREISSAWRSAHGSASHSSFLLHTYPMTDRHDDNESPRRRDTADEPDDGHINERSELPDDRPAEEAHHRETEDARRRQHEEAQHRPSDEPTGREVDDSSRTETDDESDGTGRADSLHRRTFDPSVDSVSEELVRAVAAVGDADPADLPILADVVDPEALDDLVRSWSVGDVDQTAGRVTFRYVGRRIEVSADGVIEIRAEA